MEESSGKIGSRTLGLVAEGQLFRVSKDNSLLRFAIYTINDDRSGFDKSASFKHQPNKNTTQLSLLASDYIFDEKNAKHSAVIFIHQKMEKEYYYTLLSCNNEGQVSTIFELPASGEFKIGQCDLKLFDGPIVCSIDRKQGIVHIIQRDPNTTVWEQMSFDPKKTISSSDKNSSNNTHLIDVGRYDSQSSSVQLLFASKNSSKKSKKENGHSQNNNNNNSNSDAMDVDQNYQSPFWGTVTKAGLLKSSNLDAFFSQRTENLMDPWRLFLLPLEKDSKSTSCTKIPSPYVQTACVAYTFWDTLQREFILAGTENGLLMLLEDGKVKNSITLSARPLKIALLRNSLGETLIAVQCKDAKVSVVSLKSFAVVREYSNTALMGIDDLINTFSEQLLVVFKKDVAPETKGIFPFIFVDGANEYSNFKENTIQNGSTDNSRSTLLSVSHSLQSRLRIASENLSVMEQRIKDKKENFIQACSLLDQILAGTKSAGDNNNDNSTAHTEKFLHVQEVNSSSEFLESKLSLHFSLDVVNNSKTAIEECYLILHSATSTRSKTFAVNIRPNTRTQLTGTLYLEEISSQTNQEISVNITATFLVGQCQVFEHLSTVKLKPEDLFTLQKVPHNAYTCSVSVESKTQSVDTALKNVLKHKLKLDQVNNTLWVSEKANVSATTTHHSMTTEVELKAKSEEELLLALQVLCSSLPEEIELSAAGITEGVLDVCDRFVEKTTEEAKIIANLSNLQKEFEKDKQKNQKLSKYITTMRQLQREFISMQSRTDELFARLTQLVCASCKDKK